jgi:hypothetical protein
MLEKVRSRLIQEAIQSPQLFADIAGLESYMAESYTSRSFIELLQNADDALSLRFEVVKESGFLFVANDGKSFSPDDLEALCRSAASKKTRDSSIGFRGIGFKSVVSFASEVYLFSGNLELVFSRELTEECVPGASRVPLVRIPHSIPADMPQVVALGVERLRAAGFSTVFVFTGLTSHAVEEEFSALSKESLLFLRNVTKLSLDGQDSIETSALPVGDEGVSKVVKMKTKQDVEEWFVYCRNSISIAAKLEKGRFCQLPSDRGLLFSFLPTKEVTGFGLVINAPMPTDPSRTRVVFEESATVIVEQIADVLLEFMRSVFFGASEFADAGLAEAFAPNFDPGLLAFQQKSFRTELFGVLKSRAEKALADTCMCPEWFSVDDYQLLSGQLPRQSIPRDALIVGGTRKFMRFLGVQEPGMPALMTALSSVVVSSVAAGQCVSRLANGFASKRMSANDFCESAKIWVVDSEPVDISAALATGKPLAQDFVDAVLEGIGGLRNIFSQLLVELVGEERAQVLLPRPEVASSSDSVFARIQKQGSFVAAKSESPRLEQSRAAGDLFAEVGVISSPGTSEGLAELRVRKRWRAAEEMVAEYFSAKGYEARDVSKQNLGYDVQVRNQEGVELYIEVKSIDRPNSDFALTNNEALVAKEHGEQYVVALVQQVNAGFNVMWIRNPFRHLDFERQVRQWVWVCSQYPFEPEFVSF